MRSLRVGAAQLGPIARHAGRGEVVDRLVAEGTTLAVLSADPPVFCAGADISQFEKNRASENATIIYNEAVSKATIGLAEITKPTIAKIEGVGVNARVVAG